MLDDDISDRMIHDYGLTCKFLVYNGIIHNTRINPLQLAHGDPLFYTNAFSLFSYKLFQNFYRRFSFVVTYYIYKWFCGLFIILTHSCAGQITDDTSLFTYPDGLSVANFSDPTHLPRFLDEVVNDAPADVISFCNNDAQCIFDAMETGNMEIGLETLQTNMDNINDQIVICKFNWQSD